MNGHTCTRPKSAYSRTIHAMRQRCVPSKNFRWDPLSLTAWCAISGGPCWPGGLAGVGLPFGGAVGDQAGDGQEGLVEVFSSSEVALEGSPLLVLCAGVLDADPFR